MGDAENNLNLIILLGFIYLIIYLVSTHKVYIVSLQLLKQRKNCILL